MQGNKTPMGPLKDFNTIEIAGIGPAILTHDICHQSRSRSGGSGHSAGLENRGACDEVLVKLSKENQA